MVIRYDTLLKSQGDVVEIKKAIVHPKFVIHDIVYDYDVAILQLKSPLKLKLKNINPICLPEQNDDPAVNSKLIVTGWGHLSETNPNGPEELMAVEIPTVNRSYCNKQIQNDYKKTHGSLPKGIEVNQNMICAGVDQGHKDSCSGDSGSPLISIDKDNRATIRGIVSWGIGCGRPKLAGVNTRVGVFVDFIKKNLI